MEAFGCSAGSRSLRRVPLRLSQLGHSDGKLGELRDKHQHCGLVLIAKRRRERQQPSRGPQSVPRWCRLRDATEAAASCPGLAVCRLPERPTAHDISGDV